MAVTVRQGQWTWSVEQDEDGHREYRVVQLVDADREDGPYAVLNCPGLPEEGQAWNFDNDVDEWAWCKFDRKVTPVVEGEANELWKVESVFTTRPVDKCREDPILDPLLEPMKLTISVNKYQEEALYDVSGRKITNSAHEVIRGPQNEWDASRAVVRITQNVADAEATLLLKYLDHVNDAPLWGFGLRCVKFSNFTLERKYHGNCDVYYARMLEFDCRADSFDRKILDEGTKVLNGKWDTNREWQLIDINGSPPDPSNPRHFVRAVDAQLNPIRVILDGHGKPWANEAGALFWWCVDDGVDPFVENNTCGGVSDTAFYYSACVHGPFDTELEALDNCGGNTDPDVCFDPNDLDCDTLPMTNTEPGRIFVKKYKQMDMPNKFGPDFPTVLE